MKQELREVLGKAAFDVWAKWDEDEDDPTRFPQWDEMPDESHNYFMSVGESVGKKLATLLLPVVVTTLLTEEEIRACLADALNESRWHVAKRGNE